MLPCARSVRVFLRWRPLLAPGRIAEWYNGVIYCCRHAQAICTRVRPRPHREGIRGAAAARLAAEDPGVPAPVAAELRARRAELPAGARGAARAACALHRRRHARG